MRLRYTFPLIVSMFLALLCPVASRAQTDKDAEEIRSYALTMEGVHRLYITMHEIKQAAEKDPNLHKSLSAETDDKGEQTLSSAVNKLSAYPAIVGMMANHGFTPRQFMVAEFTLIQAGFAAAALKEGTPREKLISSGAVSAQNLDFVQQHQAELEELAEKYPLQ